MIARMLLVWLLILNLGVLAWWVLHRPAAPQAVTPESPLPRLIMANEIAAAQVPLSDVPATVCVRFGPFADSAAANKALARLQGEGIRANLVNEGASHVVYMPPLADAEAASAMVARLRNEGFVNIIPITQGAQANGIALGQFASRAEAEQRKASLQEKGFDVHVASPAGQRDEGAIWVDVRAGDGFDVDAQRRAIGATRQRRLTC